MHMSMQMPMTQQHPAQQQQANHIRQMPIRSSVRHNSGRWITCNRWCHWWWWTISNSTMDLVQCDRSKRHTACMICSVLQQLQTKHRHHIHWPSRTIPSQNIP
jgi:hypothetical protein